MKYKIGDFLILEFWTQKFILFYESNNGYNNLKVVKCISTIYAPEYFSIYMLGKCRLLTDEEKLEYL